MAKSNLSKATNNEIVSMSVVDRNLNITFRKLQKEHPMLRFYFNAQMKYSFYGDMNYNFCGYILLLCTSNMHPSVVNLQVNYNFTLDSYVGVCSHHIVGECRNKAYPVDCFFESLTENYYKEQNSCLWVILRYTFCKNADKKHKLGNVLNNTEGNISIVGSVCVFRMYFLYD